MKFSNFMSRGWDFASLFCPEGRDFVHNDQCLGGGGEVFTPFESCTGGCLVGGGVVLDEIDTINRNSTVNIDCLVCVT